MFVYGNWYLIGCVIWLSVESKVEMVLIVL